MTRTFMASTAGPLVDMDARQFYPLFSAGRSPIKAARLARYLCVLALFACFIGPSFAQAPSQNSDEQSADNAESENKGKKTGGTPRPQPTKDEMLPLMTGRYTSRDLYPSLMELPDLSPEKRAEIKRLARQRMEEGLQSLAEGQAALEAATENSDHVRMGHAAAEMRASVARYESGLAAFRALEGGDAPRNIALSWFRREMNLDSTDRRPSPVALGMTPFQWTVCLLLMVLLPAALIWMYVLRMRRAAALLGHWSQSTRSSKAERRATVDSNANLATQSDSSAAAKQAPWTGLLRIASIHTETPNVKTFRFVDPADGAIPFQYLPGQFLRLSLEIDGKPVKRAYTIASTPTRNRYIEITVKREEHGLVSRHLHGKVNVGDLLNITAPAGKFTFTGSEHDSIVLIGGGVGITPLMSVVRGLTDIGWDNEIFFLYTCKNPDDFIFREELNYLQDRHRNLRLIVTFSRATEDITGFHRGRITKDFIANAVPRIAGRRIHLCGTPQMAQAVKEMLTELGVPSSEIKFEAFGTVNRKPGTLDKEGTVSQAEAPVVAFSLSEKSGPLAAGSTILEAAEAIGVDIDNACRSGTCGSCKVQLKSGPVTMDVEDALDPDEKETGMILACQARSDADVTVEA